MTMHDSPGTDRVRTPSEGVFFADDLVTLLCGKADQVLADLPAGSVDCIVTSPPYYGLRDYQVEGQIGAEATPALYVEALQAVFAQAWRVMADHGTMWVVLGDSYSSGNRAESNLAAWSASNGRGGAHRVREAQRGRHGCADRPSKNVLGMPWRVAFALQDDGWILRNEIIWAKPNPMPESVTDRLSCTHEQIFLFVKQRRYFFDLDPIRQPHRMRHQRRPSGRPDDATPRLGQPKQTYSTAARTEPGVDGHPAGRNPGDVWEIATVPFDAAHFAVFPPEIPRRAIAAGCRPGGVVLDMFSGSGTTGMAAAELGHRYIGIDLNPDYLELSLRTRLEQPSLLAEANRLTAEPA